MLHDNNIQSRNKELLTEWLCNEDDTIGSFEVDSASKFLDYDVYQLIYTVHPSVRGPSQAVHTAISFAWMAFEDELNLVNGNVDHARGRVVEANGKERAITVKIPKDFALKKDPEGRIGGWDWEATRKSWKEYNANTPIL